jgi:hypothetical protein
MIAFTIRKDVPTNIKTDLLKYEDPQISSLKEDWNNFKSPVEQLQYLAEQILLAKYTNEMNDGHSEECVEYLNSLEGFLNIVPEDHPNFSQDKLKAYASALKNFYYDKPFDALELYLLLSDVFLGQGTTLSKGFYGTYLGMHAKGQNRGVVREHMKNVNPSILQVVKVPVQELVLMENKALPNSGHYLVAYTTDCSKPTDFKYTDLSITANSAQEHLLSYDWAKRGIISFIDTFQSFGCTYRYGLESIYSMPALLNKTVHRKVTTLDRNIKVRSNLVKLLHRVITKYSIEVDPRSVYFVIRDLGYYGAETLLCQDVNNQKLASLESYSELAFLSREVLRVALEAAQDEDTDDEEDNEEEDNQDNEDVDPMDDDPESDPDADDESDEDPSDEDSDDTDLSETDDSSSDTESEDSDGSGSQTTDTTTESEKTLTELDELVISRKQTLSDYFYQKKIGQKIKNILNNPPAHLSSETVAFLEIWYLQWLFLVSADTTRSVLSNLRLK